MKKLIFVFLLYSLSILYSDELELWSQAAILIDGETDQILYQKNPNKLVAPASMTKVVTLFIVYEYISQGGHKDEYVTVSKNADWRNLPRDSSLMFIEEGQSVTLLELMKGLAIPSGNDAAIAIAEHISGSVPAFIEFMNRRVTELGFRSMKFIDASGFDDNNSITVLEFAQFVAIFYEKYPEAIEELFSLKEFSYPKIKNGETSIGLVTQFNHNPMVGYFPGCDGLKTGFIYKSGLNISLSAKRNGRRVYAVLSGVYDDDKKVAELKRVIDSAKILEYGLSAYRNVTLDKIPLKAMSVINGCSSNIYPVIPYKRNFTLGFIDSLSYSLKEIEAPVEVGESLGNVTFIQNGLTYIFPIIASNSVQVIRSNLFYKLLDIF